MDVGDVVRYAPNRVMFNNAEAMRGMYHMLSFPWLVSLISTYGILDEQISTVLARMYAKANPI